MDLNHRPHHLQVLQAFRQWCALPTELLNDIKNAAIGVTQFFNRGPTSRLKFVFSLQLFFTAFAFSIGGFIPPRTLPTFHR